MNIIIKDTETDILLYGIVLAKEITRKGKACQCKVYRLPAEAWMAFLRMRYASVPEVKTYLQAVDSGEGINPREGKLLEAIDQRIEVSEEEMDTLYNFIKED